MKALLLHGPAKAVSRKKLIEEKNKYNPESINVFEEGISSQEILSSLATVPMFTGERVIILENPSEDFTNYTPTPNPYTLIIWFDHEVSEKKSVMVWFKEKKQQVLFFPEAREVSIFPFLDMLANNEKKAFLELKKLKSSSFDTQYIITMIFYLLRNLAVTPQKAPQFVKDKLIRQRKNFSREKITSLYRQVLEIDFKIKSGFLDISQAEYSLINLFSHQS